MDLMIARYGMADALRAVIVSGGNPSARSRDLLGSAIKLLLDAGARAGGPPARPAAGRPAPPALRRGLSLSWAVTCAPPARALVAEP
ncbi:hypothetical protein ACFXI8_15315 [Streptomyces niveus]|uniref:hypothetical protein n=1 Tax=Streptomyces niveus TaxID=193462 RepID=UPI0036873A64